MRFLHLSFVLFSIYIFSSCNDSDDSGTPPATIEPTLSSIQAQVFNGTCALTSCHGSAAAGGLNLTDGISYGQLVNVRSNGDGINVPPFYRVQPGQPDSSFLYIKLTSPAPQQGARMPQGGASLSQEKLDAIRQWILNGAGND
ncbi:MAG: hypothetical protein EPO24_12370 [Bacteroidetes bacterium]|nr:MAG: hypothetical protein EPO24_12370 [Bacteroidota bacterium]